MHIGTYACMYILIRCMHVCNVCMQGSHDIPWHTYVHCILRLRTLHYMHACTPTCIHACIHAYITCTHTCIHACMRVFNVCMCIHTSHTYMHECMHGKHARYAIHVCMQTCMHYMYHIAYFRIWRTHTETSYIYIYIYPYITCILHVDMHACIRGIAYIKLLHVRLTCKQKYMSRMKHASTHCTHTRVNAYNTYMYVWVHACMYVCQACRC